MGVGVTVERVGAAAVASVEGDVDVLSGPTLRQQLLDAIADRPSLLVVDLSRTSFLDSTGLGVLVAIARRTRLIGCGFCLASPTSIVAKVLTATSLDRAWPVYPTVSAALDAHACEDAADS